MYARCVWAVGLVSVLVLSACGTGDTGSADARISECGFDSDCDDRNLCTDDRCTRDGRCQNLDNSMCTCDRASDCAGFVMPSVCEIAACVERRCVLQGDPSKNGQRCDDRNACTRNDFCQNGSCVGGDTETCEAPNDCQEPGTCNPSNGSCDFRNKANGSACNADSNGCTENDTCQSGFCRAGTTSLCDDGASCTNNSCTSTGDNTHRCETDVLEGGCYIDGSCYDWGDARPSMICQYCDPDQSQTSWAANVGASCGTGCALACDSGGSCGGSTTSDSHELNETRTAASFLGNIDDSDNFPSGRFTANLHSSGDEDWYSYVDNDAFGGLLYPRVDLEDIPAGVDYDLCAYFQCSSGTLSTMGCDAGTSSSSGGLDGCCSTRGGDLDESVSLDPDCSGSDDSGTVYVRVWRASGTSTCSYSLIWGDD